MLYCDHNLIVDTTHLVEAHSLNGAGESDGIYIITLVLSVGAIFTERCIGYPTQEARDKAFVALGIAITASEKI